MTEVTIKQSGKRGSGWWIAAIALAAIAFARIVPYLDNPVDTETHQRQQHERTMKTILNNPVGSPEMKEALQSSSKQALENQANWLKEKAEAKANQ